VEQAADVPLGGVGALRVGDGVDLRRQPGIEVAPQEVEGGVAASGQEVVDIGPDDVGVESAFVGILLQRTPAVGDADKRDQAQAGMGIVPHMGGHGHVGQEMHRLAQRPPGGGEKLVFPGLAFRGMERPTHEFDPPVPGIFIGLEGADGRPFDGPVDGVHTGQVGEEPACILRRPQVPVLKVSQVAFQGGRRGVVKMTEGLPQLGLVGGEASLLDPLRVGHGLLPGPDHFKDSSHGQEPLLVPLVEVPFLDDAFPRERPQRLRAAEVINLELRPLFVGFPEDPQGQPVDHLMRALVVVTMEEQGGSAQGQPQAEKQDGYFGSTPHGFSSSAILFHFSGGNKYSGGSFLSYDDHGSCRP